MANGGSIARLGIVAGGGRLPAMLADACRHKKIPFFILALKGQVDIDLLKNAPHDWCHLGETTRAIHALKNAGVDAVTLAGSVRQPWLMSLRPDWRTLKILLALGRRVFGDDVLLRAVAAELEREGFRMIGAHDIEPALLMSEGAAGACKPSSGHMADIALGLQAVRALGAQDIGQAAVVRSGQVVGLETARGTDDLLNRCKGQGGVLVKAAKPQQDRRFDLPAVGLRTVRNAHAAGLEGIAVESGASLLLDRDEVVAEADRLGIFLFGLKPS